MVSRLARNEKAASSILAVSNICLLNRRRKKKEREKKNMPSAIQIERAFGLTAGKEPIANSVRMRLTNSHIQEQTIRPYELYHYDIQMEVQVQGNDKKHNQSTIHRFFEHYFREPKRVLAKVNYYQVTFSLPSIMVQPVGDGRFVINVEAQGVRA